MAVHCFLLKVQARQSPGRGAHFVSTFKVEYMSVLDWKKLVETGVWLSTSSYHTSSTLQTYLEIYLEDGRARSKHTSSTVETYLEHGRNIPRARSKHTSSTVEKYRLFCGNSESKRKKWIKYSRTFKTISAQTALHFSKRWKKVVQK